MTQFFDTIEKASLKRGIISKVLIHKASVPCIICHKPLTDPKSKAIGIGPSHYKSKSALVQNKVKAALKSLSPAKKQKIMDGDNDAAKVLLTQVTAPGKPLPKAKAKAKAKTKAPTALPVTSTLLALAASKARENGLQYRKGIITAEELHAKQAALGFNKPGLGSSTGYINMYWGPAPFGMAAAKKKAKKKKAVPKKAKKKFLGKYAAKKRRNRRDSFRSDDKRANGLTLPGKRNIDAKTTTPKDDQFIFGHSTPEGTEWQPDSETADFWATSDLLGGDKPTDSGEAERAFMKADIIKDITTRMLAMMGDDLFTDDQGLGLWANETHKDKLDVYGSEEIVSNLLFEEWLIATGRKTPRRSFERFREDESKADKKWKPVFDALPQHEAMITVKVDELIREWAGSSGDSNDRSVALQLRVRERFLGEADKDYIHTESFDSILDPVVATITLTDGIFMDAFLDSIYESTQERLAAAGVESVILYRGLDMDYQERLDIPKHAPIIKNPNPGPDGSVLEDLVDELEKKVADIDAGIIDLESIRPSQEVDNEIQNLYQMRQTAQDELYDAQEDLTIFQESAPLQDAYGTQVSMQPLSSFSSDRDIADEFGSSMIVVEVPASRIFSTALTGMGCLNEAEFVILGGVTNVAYTDKG